MNPVKNSLTTPATLEAEFWMFAAGIAASLWRSRVGIGFARPLAAVGECMIEFYLRPDGLYVRTFAGYALNAAVYLARLDVPMRHVTALGDDSYSDEMIATLAAEGLGSGLVARVPGLYVIDVDNRGERGFSYLRSPRTVRFADCGRARSAFASYNLSIYPESRYCWITIMDVPNSSAFSTRSGDAAGRSP